MSKEPEIILNKLDIATILFFSKVKDQIVERVIRRWLKQLTSSKFNAGLAENIFNAFRNVENILDTKNDFEKKEKDELGKILYDSKDLGNLLKRLLREKGHLLFNFYFYKVVNTNFDQYLNPFIIGIENIINSYNSFNTIYTALNDGKIPFRIYNSQEFLNTYRSQLLPINGGLSPIYTSESISSKKNIPSLLVDNFLLQLSLLHKREDFLQAHFSALIKSIRDHQVFGANTNAPVFTVVLSSVMPNAFIKRDSNHFDKLILEIQSLGCFSGFKKLSGVQYSLKKPVFFEKHIDLGKRFDGKENELMSLTEQSRKILLEEQNHNLLYNYQRTEIVINPEERDKQKDWKPLFVHFTININAYEDIINKMFPTGPWFETDIFYDHKWNEFNKLKEYIKILNASFLNENYSDLKKFEPLINFFKLQLPELFDENCTIDRKSYTLSNHDYRLIIFFKKGREKQIENSIEALIRKIDSLIEEGSSKLDGKNPLFSNLHDQWLTYINNADSFTFDKKEKISSYKDFHGEKEFVLSKEFISVFRSLYLIKIRPIYIPKQNSDSAVYFNNYQEYWTFQSLINNIYNLEIEIEEFDKYSKTPKYLYKNDSSNVIVNLGDNEVENERLQKSLLYFGIEVKEIKNDGKSAYLKFANVDKIYLSKDFRRFYIEFIRSILAKPDLYKGTLKIFNQNCKSIGFSLINDKLIKFTIDGEIIEWEKNYTIEPYLSLINYMDINMYFKDNHSKIFNSLISCTECSKNDIRCFIQSERWKNDPEVNEYKHFCTLTKDLYNMHLPNKYIRTERGRKILEEQSKKFN